VLATLAGVRAVDRRAAGRVDEKTAGVEQADMDVNIDIKAAGTLLEKVEKAKKKTDLTALLKNKGYKAVFEGVTADDTTAFADLKTVMLERAKAVKDAKWAAGEIETRVELIKRLTNPTAVFGTPEKKGKGEKAKWQVADKVAEPSVMQYLEKGFVRDDELSTDGDAKRPKKVFNKEFIQAMMRFGFNTGATWGTTDTMHFDFVEGYHVVQGGWGSKYGPG
jgi:hypothetical protein